MVRGRQVAKGRAKRVSYNHFPVMIDRWCAQHESRDVGDDLLPAIVFDNFARVPWMLVPWIIRPPLLAENQLNVGGSGGSDLERFPHELVLGVNLCDSTP